MALQIGRDVFYIAKQAARGTLAAAPAFAHGLTGGGISVDPKDEKVGITSAALAPSGAFREKVETEANVETLALAHSIGVYFLAALGNVATTGTTSFTHTFTLGAASPYLSAWIKKGDGLIVASRDCKLDELELEWDENKPLEVKSKLAGGKVSFPASVTPVFDETSAPTFFTPVNGTFAFAASGSTPGAAASILSGGITIKRDVESYFFSGDIEAGDNAEGVCTPEIKLKMLAEDTSVWRTLLTGTSAGTTVSQTPVYGSFEFNFTAGSSTLKIAASRVAFTCDLPEADPDGGAAEIELSGICYLSGATPLTVTLVNAQSSY
jgi:hypothetical protein